MLPMAAISVKLSFQDILKTLSLFKKRSATKLLTGDFKINPVSMSQQTGRKYNASLLQIPIHNYITIYNYRNLQLQIYQLVLLYFSAITFR